MQGADDAHLGRTGMGQLAIDQRPGNDADHLAARGQGRVRDDAHEPDAAAAVDDADPAPRKTLADGPGERRVRRVVAGRGAAEDADRGASVPERRELSAHPASRASPVRDLVLLGRAPLPERAAARRLRSGLEDRVVPEAAAALSGRPRCARGTFPAR